MGDQVASGAADRDADNTSRSRSHAESPSLNVQHHQPHPPQQIGLVAPSVSPSPPELIRAQPLILFFARPFHAQIDYIPSQFPQQQQQQQQVPTVGRPFDMLALAVSRPLGGPNSPQRMYFDQDSSRMLAPGALYSTYYATQYSPQRGPPYYAAQQQPQHFYAPAYPPARLQHCGLAQAPDMYAYGIPYQPIDPRFASQAGFVVAGVMPGAGATDFSRRTSTSAPVPSYPRGPPKKPKQSGHALWVGNLPPQATVTDLKDHFSRDATKDIESLFLISKSNCAFVNYRTEAACVAAMTRFHDSRFYGVRLVCRLRRGSTSTSDPSPIPDSLQQIPSPTPAEDAGPSPTSESDGPVIVGHTPSPSSSAIATSALAPRSTSPTAPKPPAKFFIVKSLTLQDLEASVLNGTWATQSHNEQALSRAYEEADNVYLIFSANKSGEYFGYARMASQISGEPINLGTMVEGLDEAGTPQSIPTPATETAPKGCIVDDSARGTIFWEADMSDDESGDESPTKEVASTGSSNGGGLSWGRQFKVEWISTARLPFFRTRGLRNSWNANREVKIARDGTELEPGVGTKLVQMFSTYG